MTWRQILRSIEVNRQQQQRDIAKVERESMRRQRELARQEREMAKYSEDLRAANEVEQFENYLELIVSIHKDCGARWDWNAISQEKSLAQPTRVSLYEDVARVQLERYKPGFFERLFGRSSKKLTILEQAVNEGHKRDDASHHEALRIYHEKHTAWNIRKQQSQQILAKNSSVYIDALRFAGAFKELAALQIQVTPTAVESDAMAFACNILNDELIPREEIKLTAKGKVSTKSFSMSRYWGLFQDHLCSVALRTAREAFAVLPLLRVVVNIGPTQVNTKTGHREPVTFLAVNFLREVLDKLNLNRIDPSDAMTNFSHQMKFKKTTGFEPIESMDLAEEWYNLT